MGGVNNAGLRAIVSEGAGIRSAAEQKQMPGTALWEIARAGHTGGITAAPAEYERRVMGFFDRALRPRR